MGRHNSIGRKRVGAVCIRQIAPISFVKEKKIGENNGHIIGKKKEEYAMYLKKCDLQAESYSDCIEV